jgi:rhodanese-related sulfurtransferase
MTKPQDPPTTNPARRSAPQRRFPLGAHVSPLRRVSRCPGIRGLLARTALLALAPTLVACLANLLTRPEPIDWIAGRPYPIFVDCPEYLALAEPIHLPFALAWPKKIVFVDARTKEEFAAAHIEEAINIPFDPLFASIPRCRVRMLGRLARDGTVVAYGARGLGEFLGHELASTGLPDVHYLWGGLEGWLEAGLPSSTAGKE